MCFLFAVMLKDSCSSVSYFTVVIGFGYFSEPPRSSSDVQYNIGPWSQQKKFACDFESRRGLVKCLYLVWCDVLWHDAMLCGVVWFDVA